MMSIFNTTNIMIKVIRTFPMDNVMHNTQFPLLYYVTNRNPTYLLKRPTVPSVPAFKITLAQRF